MFGPDFISNPYRTYQHLRTTAPLHWANKFRNGAWLVTRYADVLAGLHDTRLSSQRSHTLTAALPREAQGDDLVSLLLRVEEEGEVLTEEELLAQCTLLLVAGYETTRNLLGN